MLDSKRDCNGKSSCHWESGSNADCSWKKDKKASDPGCCTISCTLEDLKDSKYLEICPDLWNKEDCHTPKDPKEKKQCQWTPTKEQMDCTILWPTKDSKKKDLSWDVDPADVGGELLFGADSIKLIRDTMGIRASLSAAIVLLIAGIAVCKLQSLWQESGCKRRCGAESEDEEGAFGYIKIADADDSAAAAVWGDEDKSGYGTYQSVVGQYEPL